MLPVIGVTTSINEDESVLQMNRSYIAALMQAGAAPLLLPPAEDEAVISRYVGMIDGLLLSGGGDVDPSCYGETQRWECGDISPVRDSFELRLCKAFMQSGSKPLLGICRGMQVMNTALDGTLYQDLASDFPAATIAHRQKQRPLYTSHIVTVDTSSHLSRIIGCEQLRVNSHHHQAVKQLAEALRAVATAPDGVIEAVEMPGHPFCIGVQWHPERLCDQKNGDGHYRLFTAFVQACQTR